ncbi:hypothetical protein GCM10007049_25910 [Echinicola pacifica]|uniref:DUF4230 domain-containing protein n=1 Tax=Echinicola pacifica TaxID=346377 RepID=A0A918USV0_9BACT|nr:DUF4230 domain-containing protein [Echinicola pacifica]GGZ31547.1 hypothetical protein GCM10007049_25910 [Echinicola pacifica]
MRKFIFGLVVGFLVIWGFRWFAEKREEAATLEESTALIQKEVNNVRKLIVTEGHFSQVFNYKQTERIFGNLWTTEKKALVVVNAEVQVAFDLGQVSFQLDADNKTLFITSIPPPEIKIFPDLQFYDVAGDYFNPFGAADFNRIKSKVNASINQKIEKSEIKQNAETRLIAELARFYVLTNSLGWKLVYENTEILSENDLKVLELD